MVWYSLDSETFHTAAKNAVVGPKAFHVPQNIFFGLVALQIQYLPFWTPLLAGQVAVPVPAFGLVDLPISLVTGNRERQMQTADAILWHNEHKSLLIQLAFFLFYQNRRDQAAWGTFQMCGAYRSRFRWNFSPAASNPAPRIFHNPQRQ